MIVSNETLQQFKVSEVELIYRSKIKATDRPRVSDSKTAYQILLQSWDENKIDLQEQFKILLLNNANRCLGVAEIGTGGMTSCIADPKLIFATALKGKASKLILAHNHPSGNLEPSRADLELTRKVVNAGRLLDIGVVDHLIVTGQGYKSFADDGLMP
ncbi:JAB domain-containing protein [Taibaiella koreensis]|uniref:JAB domain-containing protein n=1 Tax=Taibaiella koreensis TaxID=1268548 RepID=UPI000E5A026C|nr:JAB domain-containing protein [Taibaiella koreensis]